MPRAWTRRGQLAMIGEIATLARQVEMIVSQQRALKSSDARCRRICELLQESRRLLSQVEIDLASGSSPFATAREVAFLHRTAVRETARAEALRHGNRR